MSGFGRYFLAALLALAQLVMLVPSASAQEVERLRMTFNPARITSQIVGGCAPNAPCPLERGVTYTVNVALTVNVAAESMVVEAQPGGLEIESSIDSTPALPAGGRATFSLDVTVPEAGGRNDRTFYFGRIRIFGEQGTFILPISVSVPPPKITWGPLIDPATGDRARAVASVGSGETIRRQVNINSNVDVEDFDIRSNAPDRVTLTGVPDTMTAGRNVPLTIEYEAPIVNRRTRTDVLFAPASGLQALKNTLRLRLSIQPVQITWSPPFVRRTLELQDRRAVPVTVTATSNYTVENVTFKSADLGLTPLTSHAFDEPITMRAGVPVNVSFLICPGYAPTQYFLGISAFQNTTKPLNRRLQIRSNVIDETGEGVTPNAPECVV